MVTSLKGTVRTDIPFGYFEISDYRDNFNTAGYIITLYLTNNILWDELFNSISKYVKYYHIKCRPTDTFVQVSFLTKDSIISGINHSDFDIWKSFTQTICNHLYVQNSAHPAFKDTVVNKTVYGKNDPFEQ